jgi:hypothetical protein
MYRTRSGEFHEIAQGAGGKSELGVIAGIAGSRTGDVAHILDTGEERAQALQEAVKFNQPIPDSILALPPDIERLMKRYPAQSQLQ